MNVDFLIQLVTIYGPLGLGWVLWWIDRKAAEKASSQREDLLREALQNSTVAITTLAERLRGAMNASAPIIIRRNLDDEK